MTAGGRGGGCPEDPAPLTEGPAPLTAKGTGGGGCGLTFGGRGGGGCKLTLGGGGGGCPLVENCKGGEGLPEKLLGGRGLPKKLLGGEGLPKKLFVSMGGKGLNARGLKNNGENCAFSGRFSVACSPEANLLPSMVAVAHRGLDCVISVHPHALHAYKRGACRVVETHLRQRFRHGGGGGAVCNRLGGRVSNHRRAAGVLPGQADALVCASLI